VATRLPAEFRLAPRDAARLLEEEVFARMSVHDLPHAARLDFIRSVSDESITGGRVYDGHIADVARTASARVIVTDNRRHFLAALRYGIRVDTTSEFARALKG
jgi:hypothetical protein